MTSKVTDLNVKNDMREMYEGQKATLTQVSEKFGVSVNTAKNYILEVGGKIRPRGRQVGFQVTTTPRKSTVVESDLVLDVEDDTIDNFSHTEDGHSDFLEDYDNSDIEYESYN